MKVVADENIPFVKECFSSFGTVEVMPAGRMDAASVSEADILVVRSVTRVDARLLESSRVGFVATATIGFDHVDLAYLQERNIGFASAPGCNANSVAEYVIAALLAVAGKRAMALEGRTLGIIGAGNVGGRVAQKAAALGMEVLLNDPPLKRKTGMAKYHDIERILNCEFVTVHTPLTFEGPDKTFHLCGDVFFKSLKKTAVFCNTARGAVTDGAALKRALGRGNPAAAVIDVWEGEPDIDTGLLEAADIATAHIAGYSLDGKAAGTAIVCEAARRYFNFDRGCDVGSLLPPPAVPLIKPAAAGGEQEVLAEAVRKVYDIEKDGSVLRAVADMPRPRRCEAFARIRKNYPVRREFQNTRVILDKGHSRLRRMLSGVGFVVD